MNRIILAVEHFRQGLHNDCGVVSAAMVLTYLKVPFRYEQLLRLLQAKWFGVPAFRIRELEKLGVTVIYKQGTLTELYEHLANNRPCIVFVRTSELPY